jgi:hypothetical protein
MQAQDIKNRMLPHLYVVLSFFLFAHLYSYPLMQGMVLQAHDYISWKAMVHEVMEWHKRTGENVLWSNSMFGGMPMYPIYLPGNNNVGWMVQDLIDMPLPYPTNFIFITLTSFYFLLVGLGASRWLAIGGAVAYAFSTYNPVIISAGHYIKILCIGYLPLAILGLLLIYRGRYLAGGGLMTFMLAMQITNGHYQIVYYTGIIILFTVAGIFINALQQKRMRQFFTASAIALGFAILAAGPSATSLMTTVGEYNKYTMRGGHSELTINQKEGKGKGLDINYAFQWSNGIGETFCLIVPYLYGGSSNETADHAPKTSEAIQYSADRLPLYWGPQPFLSGPVYLGAIVCFLFALGLLVIRHPLKWTLLAVSVLAIMLSWGKHFPLLNNWFFEHVPYYSAFRAPSMILVIVQFTFPLIGFWGIIELSKKDINREDVWKKIKMAAGITAGLCLVLALGGSSFFDFTDPEKDQQYGSILKLLMEDRADLAMKSSLRSAFLIIAAAALLWAWLKKEMIKPQVAMIGLGLLVTIDLLPVAHNYLNKDNFIEKEADEAMLLQPRPVDQQIMQDPDPYYRVLDLSRNTFNDAMQAVFHKSVGGYSATKMQIYQDLIDVHFSKGFNAEVLNMLNTKYLILPAGPNREPVAQRLPTACGNAWFVDEIKWVKTADEEILALNAPALGDTNPMPDAFNPRTTAVIRENWREQAGNNTLGKDSNAYVKLVEYGLNKISFESSNSSDGFAVFSDIYYPKGWKAYIDGKETPIVRTNYVLRGLQIPAGNHQIVFEFKPESYHTGRKIALVCSLLVVGLCVGGIVSSLRAKKKPDDDASAV